MDTDFYKEYFELEDRHWWFVGRRRIFLDTLDRAIGSGADGRRVLDVGCGTGTMLGHLSRYGSVDGVDASEEAVAFCKARGFDTVRLSTGTPLPFTDGKFDLVTALDVVEHVDDDVGLLSELRRIARPGGTLLVSVPAYMFLWGAQDEVSHHRRRYTASELRGRFTAAGWSVTRLTYFNTLLFPPIAAIRLLRPKSRKVKLQSDFTLTPPGPGNAILARVFGAEASLLRRRDLPFGVSILALARNDP